MGVEVGILDRGRGWVSMPKSGFGMRFEVEFQDKTQGWVLVSGVGVGFLDGGRVHVSGPGWVRVSRSSRVLILGPWSSLDFGTKVGVGFPNMGRVGFPDMDRGRDSRCGLG
ncbi:hypothetical protein TIFTF001_026322 [Ficus carica]|uniref:Uncharacterized protein n=1 Tax=Ficus carica TaxID=3494 RepID=A0AA88DKZ0_FICCA|nr:hypothetical protein TIFTF001_026322 [Ficus carica]